MQRFRAWNNVAKPSLALESVIASVMCLIYGWAEETDVWQPAWAKCKSWRKSSDVVSDVVVTGLVWRPHVHKTLLGSANTAETTNSLATWNAEMEIAKIRTLSLEQGFLCLCSHHCRSHFTSCQVIESLRNMPNLILFYLILSNCTYFYLILSNSHNSTCVYLTLSNST